MQKQRYGKRLGEMIFFENDEQEKAVCTEEEEDSVFGKAAKLIILAAIIISSLLGALSYIISHTAQAGTESTPSPAVQRETETAAPLYTREPDTRKKVLIDAGHGGFDPGTAGPVTGITESTVNLQIAQKLQSILEGQGYCVMMTRTDEDALAAGKDEDMQARCEMIKRSDADIFISIHQNAFDGPDVCGCEVYYHETQPESRNLAVCIEKELAVIPDAKPSRGVKTYGHMLTKFRPNSILIECGFITNPYEEAILTDEAGQMRIAEAIARGVNSFFDTYYSN